MCVCGVYLVMRLWICFGCLCFWYLQNVHLCLGPLCVCAYLCNTERILCCVCVPMCEQPHLWCSLRMTCPCYPADVSVCA